MVFKKVWNQRCHVSGVLWCFMLHFGVSVDQKAVQPTSTGEGVIPLIWLCSLGNEGKHVLLFHYFMDVWFHWCEWSLHLCRLQFLCDFGGLWELLRTKNLSLWLTWLWASLNLGCFLNSKHSDHQELCISDEFWQNNFSFQRSHVRFVCCYGELSWFFFICHLAHGRS